ncbi:hypothetical protein V6N11_056485 [Hibiscus sabdariffa]|uniref:Transmembrane protein n=1 Tax=Hibiscus sabdariffa TaxID=183260 RepID=A0ABR2T4J9_9ROSI
MRSFDATLHNNDIELNIVFPFSLKVVVKESKSPSKAYGGCKQFLKTFVFACFGHMFSPLFLGLMCHGLACFIVFKYSCFCNVRFQSSEVRCYLVSYKNGSSRLRIGH